MKAAGYKPPKQARAAETEAKFLKSMDILLHQKSFAKLTVAEIAEHANLEAGAFLKRFGSKKQALLILWQRFCDECIEASQDFVRNLPDNPASFQDACIEMSTTLENLQLKHFPANRAINEHFMEELQVAEPTKITFMQSVEMMRFVQKKYLQETITSDIGAFAAAQILQMINYNYAIKAMPALPQNPKIRHHLIGVLIANSLKL